MVAIRYLSNDFVFRLRQAAGLGRKLRLARWYTCANFSRHRFYPLVIVWMIALTSAPQSAAATDLRLRITWGGGGVAAAWTGSIRFDSAAGSTGSIESMPPPHSPRLTQPRWLGSATDMASSIVVTDDVIRLRPEQPSLYRGLDITVHGELDDVLVFEIGEAANGTPPPIRVPLQELVSETYNQPLDAVGNRLFVQRAPGDSLRVQGLTDHFVFAPEQTWALVVQPHLPPISVTGRSRLQVRMLHSRADSVLWRDERMISANEDGTFPPISDLNIPIPAQEGCYDLVLQWNAASNRTLFHDHSEKIERRIQFVVIDPRRVATPLGESAWREIISFDASQPQWWKRLSHFPQWESLAIAPTRLRGKGTARAETYRGATISRLDPDGWQVYPLPVAHPGTPHILEVDCPAGSQQDLGISIVEPAASDSEKLESLDFAVRTSGGTSRSDDESRCRVIFWPRTKSPQVLLTNAMHEASDLPHDSVARFGRIRLLNGPSQLPPTAMNVPQCGFRTAILQLDGARLPKHFNVELGVDASSARYLSDWQSFYDAGTRLTDYLRHLGFDGASLSCQADGGSLTGPATEGHNAMLDSGAYFGEGNDPLPKDVIEMLLRMFDRDGLRLVLSLRFNAPLPALERIRENAAECIGIDLVDIEGNSRRHVQPAGDAAGQYYNVLDLRVQQAILDSIRRLVDRYGHHASLAGIALEMRPDTSTHLPGLPWGYDIRTIADFQREMSQEIVRLGVQSVTAEQLRDGPLLPHWLRWRATRISHWYQQLAAELQQARPDTVLILATSGLSDEPVMMNACRPGLPVEEIVPLALFRLGLDLRALAAIEGVTVTKPYHRDTVSSTVRNGIIMAFSADSQWTDATAPIGLRSSELIEPTERQEIPLAAAKWLGESSEPIVTHRRRVHEATSVRRRLARAMRANDCELLLWGGSALAMSDSPDARDWLTQFRQLPVGHYVDHTDKAAHPVVVRSRSHAGKTFIYALNDSPWPVATRVDLQVTSHCQFASLRPQPTAASPDGSTETLPRADQWQLSSELANWTVRLQPYELIAGILSDAEAKVIGLHTDLPSDVIPDLQERFASVADRLANVKTPTRYQELANPGFDAPPLPLSIPGWQWVRVPEVIIETDTTVRHSGSASLRMESNQPVAWVRSDPIPVPETGRLAVQAMLRFSDHPTIPPIRLALEGRYQGKPYYRYAQVDVSTMPPESEFTAGTDKWMPFILHVADLPTADLDELRVRFDLMGAGRLWIDDVRLFHLAFTPDEQMQLSKIVGLADFELRDGRPADCARTLDGYWPRFLEAFVPPPTQRVASLPTNTPARSPRNSTAAPQTPSPRPGMLQRVRRMLPRL